MLGHRWGTQAVLWPNTGTPSSSSPSPDTPRHLEQCLSSECGSGGARAGLGPRSWPWAGLTPSFLRTLWASPWLSCLDLGSPHPVMFLSSTVVPDTEKEQEWTPVSGPLLALKEEDQLLVRRLGRHVLNGEGN